MTRDGLCYFWHKHFVLFFLFSFFPFLICFFEEKREVESESESESHLIRSVARGSADSLPAFCLRPRWWNHYGHLIIIYFNCNAMVVQSTTDKQKMSKDTTMVTWWLFVFNCKYIWLQSTITKQRNHNIRLFWWDLQSELWIHIIWIGNNNNNSHVQGTTIITFSEAFLPMTTTTSTKTTASTTKGALFMEPQWPP